MRTSGTPKRTIAAVMIRCSIDASSNGARGAGEGRLPGCERGYWAYAPAAVSSRLVRMASSFD